MASGAARVLPAVGSGPDSTWRYAAPATAPVNVNWAVTAVAAGLTIFRKTRPPWLSIVAE